MLYGLYLSAAGVLSGEYRQDLIANNLANVSTPGFKRDLAIFQQRSVESRASGWPLDRHDLLDRMSGGILAAPTHTARTTLRGPYHLCQWRA